MTQPSSAREGCPWLAGELPRQRTPFEWEPPVGVTVEQSTFVDHIDSATRRQVFGHAYTAVCSWCGRRSEPRAWRADALDDLAALHRATDDVCTTCASTRHVERERSSDGYRYDADCPTCTSAGSAEDGVRPVAPLFGHSEAPVDEAELGQPAQRRTDDRRLQERARLDLGRRHRPEQQHDPQHHPLAVRQHTSNASSIRQEVAPWT